jgi:peptidase M15-like protein
MKLRSSGVPTSWSKAKKVRAVAAGAFAALALAAGPASAQDGEPAARAATPEGRPAARPGRARTTSGRRGANASRLSAQGRSDAPGAKARDAARDGGAGDASGVAKDSVADAAKGGVAAAAKDGAVDAAKDGASGAAKDGAAGEAAGAKAGPSSKSRRGKTARRERSGDAPCLRDRVEIGRPTGEYESFALVRCDGKPADGAVERLAILLRPYSAPKPALPTTLPEGRGREWAPGVRNADAGLLTRLQAVAEHYRNKRIVVVSGYRPASVGSYHKDARAVDVRVEGVRNEDLVAFCRGLRDTGCGYYPNSSFVHFDVRPGGTGHVYWIDASGPGESPRYVSSWPPPRDEPLLERLPKPEEAAPRDEHTHPDVAGKKAGKGIGASDRSDEAPPAAAKRGADDLLTRATTPRRDPVEQAEATTAPAAQNGSTTAPRVGRSVGAAGRFRHAACGRAHGAAHRLAHRPVRGRFARARLLLHVVLRGALGHDLARLEAVVGEELALHGDLDVHVGHVAEGVGHHAVAVPHGDLGVVLGDAEAVFAGLLLVHERALDQVALHAHGAPREAALLGQELVDRLGVDRRLLEVEREGRDAAGHGDEAHQQPQVAPRFGGGRRRLDDPRLRIGARRFV